MPFVLLPALMLISAAMNAQEAGAPPPPLPSAVHCAALFALTLEELSQKSGDPEMTKGFAEDAAALRKIVIAGVPTGPNAEATADAAIAVEKKVLAVEAATRKAKGDDSAVDLKPCYRVKALGPRGE